MSIVYCPQAISGAIIALDENEFHHLQVLRIAEGGTVQVFDGRGHLYSGVLTAMTRKSASVQIGELIKSVPAPAARLHIAIAPTKNIERMEWFVEKATEIGIEEITPVICRRSERREVRTDRLDKVVLSAAKQSLQLYLPRLHDAVSLAAFLQSQKNENTKKCIAYCGEQAIHLRDAFNNGETLTVLIGPEGDFTDEEVALAKECGFIPVSLGESRLRTETAGVMVSAIFALK